MAPYAARWDTIQTDQQVATDKTQGTQLPMKHAPDISTAPLTSTALSRAEDGRIDGLAPLIPVGYQPSLVFKSENKGFASPLPMPRFYEANTRRDVSCVPEILACECCRRGCRRCCHGRARLEIYGDSNRCARNHRQKQHPYSHTDKRTCSYVHETSVRTYRTRTGTY